MNTPTNKPSSNAENARLGYQVAMDLVTSYGNGIWSMFNAMLMANSIVVAGATFIFTGQASLGFLRILLPIMGLLLCITWFLLVKRAHEYSSYYMLSAKEIEERYLSENVNTISRGGDFGSGEKITLELGGKTVTRRMSFWGRLIRMELVSYFVIVIFIAFYIGIFLQN